MTESKHLTGRRVVLASLVSAAVLFAAATGGMGLWARGTKAPAAGFSGEQSGGTSAQGQRSGQTPQRPPQVEDILPPQWPWWADAEVQKAVGLTARQVERLDAIFTERNTAMSAFIGEFRKRRDELRQIAGERKVSTEEFAIPAASFEALNSKLRESRLIMLYRMSRELSDEQYTKLQEFRDRRQRGGRRGNPPNR